ncbi:MULTISPECIES: hypothetical protein [Bacillus]|uniref:hypothetical protein n=1 Tax=Bacillus TaxID=1386 RepID=UPI001E2C3E0C|nr:hypothetical protein [Bacillus cereus]MCC2457812.1 hypothetical protein [Bacillus cereus]HEQ3529023.1 hypothetical protein [Bacillus cereus]
MKGPKFKAPKGLGLPKGKIKDHLKLPKEKINKRSPNPSNYFVNVCVYILPGAQIENNRISKDFATAKNIWGFEFRTVVHDLRTNPDGTPNTDPQFQVDTTDLECSNTLPDTPKETDLIIFGARNCARSNPSHIIVFYTGAPIIQGDIRACTKFRALFNIIFLSNTFAPDTLAHEFGHTFFNANASLVGKNPYKPLPSDPVHSSDNSNIMAPGTTRNEKTTANFKLQVTSAIAANNPRVVFPKN